MGDLLLNLGSGDLPAPEPWVNVDAYAGVNPDVVADVRRLPFEDGTVSAVYCGHLLEHLDLESGVPAALTEVRRVLAPGGRACFVGPDYDRAVETGDEVLVRVVRDGSDRWPGDRHLWLSTALRALAVIRELFPDAREISIDTVDDFWPVSSRVGWQFAVEV